MARKPFGPFVFVTVEEFAKRHRAYTKGMKKFGLKELLIDYDPLMIDDKVAEKILREIGEQMYEGEIFDLGKAHYIDDKDHLKHVFHLRKTLMNGKLYLEVEYFTERMFVWPMHDGFGDGYTYLFNGLTGDWIRLDKLVYCTFNGSPEGTKSFDDFNLIHVDGDKMNNALDNLRLVM